MCILPKVHGIYIAAPIPSKNEHAGSKHRSVYPTVPGAWKAEVTWTQEFKDTLGEIAKHVLKKMNIT